MSLGALVGRFSDFLADSLGGTRDDVSAAVPHDDLLRIRETYGHHLVVLALLARADGLAAPSEREVILNHCIERAKKAGIELTETEKRALRDYLSEFSPFPAQLELAVKHLRLDSQDDVVALVVAARAIVDADGVRRPREVDFLSELARDLATL